MAQLVTDAIVLHTADYLESSRILRLATREAGVQSVVARGARNSRKRFGSAIDLFAVGQAQIEMRPGRDLHTLSAFDVANSQSQLAADLARFSAASALAECALRIVHEESAPGVFDEVLDAFARLGVSEGAETVSTTLGSLWRLVRDVGFAPSMDLCADCHKSIGESDDAVFSHTSGGVLCLRCGVKSPAGRRLPADARQAILAWMSTSDAKLSHKEAKAHQRLLREFLGHHLTDGRPLRAFSDWEAGTFTVGVG